MLAQKENINEDDVLMFYNAFAPPTGFDVDEDGNAIDTKMGRRTEKSSDIMGIGYLIQINQVASSSKTTVNPFFETNGGGLPHQ